MLQAVEEDSRSLEYAKFEVENNLDFMLQAIEKIALV